MDGVHDGHRGRLKKRFEDHGLENFNDINLLELLLFYAIPRKDTNPIAHALLDEFGSLTAVFKAKKEELVKVPGIGQSAATLIKLIPQVAKRYSIEDSQNNMFIRTAEELGDFFIPRFMFLKNEELHIVCLDDKCSILCAQRLSEGIPNATEMNVRRITDTVLRCDATQAAIAHNHPDGLLVPSRADVYLTERVKDVLEAISVSFLGHVLVCGNEYKFIKI